ncbi:ATP synthase delta chain, chloroplastic [Dorcoceras hygrometricum]|uniref:ATP synthase delta chain, chloroplastic n=1 Tax=Dorcoceras hygrometricum TaxID=472368 RepID=A0A2Z7CMW2_9LAMI|nr:ATP synthase delta chain, chloroplastic [Dorcoceras hygrometricum]
MAAPAALQQAPITFQSRSLLSSQLQSTRKIKLSLSTLLLPKLTLKSRQSRRRTGGGGSSSGARMAESAAGSYANALADVAKSNNTLDQTSSDLEAIDKVFSDEAVVSFFVNPTITEEEKGKIVDEIAKKSNLQPHVANFLNILVDMKRIDMIREIIKEFDVVFNKMTETELAVVSSVVELESQHLAQIAKSVQKLTGARNVRIKTKIDPTLVAGFTVRYGSSGSKLIDMSVKKQLEEIALQLDLGDIQLAV